MADLTKPTEEPEADETETRRINTELKAIFAIMRALDELDDSGRGLVVAYLASRYKE